MLLITGMPGSGKTTLAGYTERYGYQVVTMGDIVREIAEKRGLEPSKENLAYLAEELRRIGGREAVAKRCMERLREMGIENIVIDGIRNLEEVETFRATFKEALLIAVHASPKTRFERLRRRRREDDPTDWEEFYRRDLRELELGLGSVIAMADLVLINEGSLEELRESFQRVIEEIGG